MDGAQEHVLSFLPYADDDRFPAQDYQAKFEVLEWETPFDPDGELASFVLVATSKNLLNIAVEMIQMETVKRLYVKKRVDILDIDRMKMFKDFRVSHNTGLKWEQSQRLVVAPILNHISDSLMIISPSETCFIGLVPLNLSPLKMSPPKRDSYLITHLMQVI